MAERKELIYHQPNRKGWWSRTSWKENPHALRKVQTMRVRGHLMPTIEIPDALFNRLQKLAIPLVDTPTTVIEHVIDHYESCKDIEVAVVDAEHAWSNTLRLAEALKVQLEVDFDWMQKQEAAYPGQMGRLSWNPS